MQVAFVATTGLGHSFFVSCNAAQAFRPQQCEVVAALRRSPQMLLGDDGDADSATRSSPAAEEEGDNLLRSNVTLGVSREQEPLIEDESLFVDGEKAEDPWFAVSTDELDAAAADRAAALQDVMAEDGVLDLGAVDNVGRNMMSVAGYQRVVNVNVDAGGALENDEDNNELLSGVGFDALLDDERLVNIMEKDFGFETTTHVQLSAMPRIAEGSDVMIQSYTGTGKTLAFLLPIFEGIDEENTSVQAVVIAPTRELAMQITREAERLCKGSEIRVMPLIGGANPARQAERLKIKPPQIVIGTPGRLAELEGNRVLRLRKCRTVVVDEIDQCMQDSFVQHLEYVISGCPRDRQIVFVSATGDNDAVRAYAQKWMRVPELLRVLGQRKVPSNLEHWCTVVPARMRIDVLRRLMTAKDAPKQAICFVDDPRRVDIVCERLFEMKLAAGALRGNAHKLERAEVLRLFRKGAVPLLVTTEVAARGLDVPEVTHVFNLDLPTDADHYVHRAGRTGRAGRKGIVVSIATAETAFVISKFEKELELEIKRMEPRGGVYATPLQRNTAPRTERERIGSKALAARDKPSMKRVSTVPKGLPSAKAAAAAAASGAAREERLASRFGPRPRSLAKARASGAMESSITNDKEGFKRTKSSSSQDFPPRRSDSAERHDHRAYCAGDQGERVERSENRPSLGAHNESFDRDSVTSREGRIEDKRTGGGYQSGDGGMRQGRGRQNSQSRGVAVSQSDRESRFQRREEEQGYANSRGRHEGRRSTNGTLSRGEGEDQSRRRHQPRGRYHSSVDSREGGGFQDRSRVSGGDRISSHGDRRGGASRGGKPTGAELRLKNKESKKMRENSGTRDSVESSHSGTGLGPSFASEKRKQAAVSAGRVVALSDNDDDDNEGYFLPGQERKKPKRKRAPLTLKQRAKEGNWVGNRANVPKSDSTAGESSNRRQLLH